MNFKDWARTSELKTAPDVRRKGYGKANHSLIPVFERRKMFEDVDTGIPERSGSQSSRKSRLTTRKDVSRSSSFRSSKRLKTEDGNGVNKQLSSNGQSAFPLWQRLRNFGHYDTQSMSLKSFQANTADIIAAKKLTGASAAQSTGDNNPDTCQDVFNHLIASCPAFKNEIGGDDDWLHKDSPIIVYRDHLSHDKQKRLCSREKLIMDGELPLKDLARGPTSQQVSEVLQPQAGKRFRFEFLDYGAAYYRNYFFGQEHQNFFGVDENYGPVAISLKRERLPEDLAEFYNILPSPGQSSVIVPKHQFRVIVRTSQLTTLRGTVLEESVPSSTKTGTSKGIPPKDVVDYITQGELQPNSLKLGKNDKKVFTELVRLDEQELNNRYKIGVIYCKAGQTTEEEMYNNEYGSPAFDEFLELLGDKVKMRGFTKYRAQLDNKTDTTGEHSVYTEFRDTEMMFHVSTYLPYTASDNQQLLRKRHIGNDIVTLVFQEPGSQPFSAKSVRSHFQHIFLVVRVENPNTFYSKYRVAVSRSKDIPYFGPSIPEEAAFDKNDVFREFILTKLINACNASLCSDKFSNMAIRTRKQYIMDLSADWTTGVTLEQTGRVGNMLRRTITGGHRKRERGRQDGALLFTPGALIWSVRIVFLDGKPLPFSEDYDSSLECIMGIGPDLLIFLDVETMEMMLQIPMTDITGWICDNSRVNLFYDNSHCVSLDCIENEEDAAEFCTRLHSIAPSLTLSHEATLMEFPRGSNGLLGFGINEAGVVQKVDGLARSVGLQTESRLLQVEDRLLCCHTHRQIMDILTDKHKPCVKAYVVPPPPKGRVAKYYPPLNWSEIWSSRPSHIDVEESSKCQNGTSNGVSTPEPMESVQFRQRNRKTSGTSHASRMSYMEAVQAGEYDDLQFGSEYSEPIYDRLMKDSVFQRPKSPIRSHSPTLGSRKHEDNVGYTRIKRAVKPARASVVPSLANANRSKSQEPESMEYRVEEYSPGVLPRITSSTKITDPKPQVAAPLSEKYPLRRLTTGSKRPIVEVHSPSPGQVNELTKRFSFTQNQPPSAGSKHSSKIPVSNTPLKATTSASAMTKTPLSTSSIRESQTPTQNGIEEEVKLRENWSKKARPASWDVSTLLNGQDEDVFVTKDDTSATIKADIDLVSFHRNSNIRSAFRRKSSSREFSPEPVESGLDDSPTHQKRPAPIEAWSEPRPVSPVQEDQPMSLPIDYQKLSQSSHNSQSSQGSQIPVSVRERTMKWEARGGGVPSYFTLPKSFRHKATDVRRDSSTSSPSPTTGKPITQRRASGLSVSSTGSKIPLPSSSIPQPTNRVNSPRSSVSTTSNRAPVNGRKNSLPREDADGSCNLDEVSLGGSLDSRSPRHRSLFNARSISVPSNRKKGESLLPTKRVISTASMKINANQSTKENENDLNESNQVETSSCAQLKTGNTAINGSHAKVSPEPSDVHNGLQSLSLSDRNGSEDKGDGYSPRVEDWIRQTSQTALNIDPVTAPDLSRDISSPTFTDNSLNFSQISDQSQDLIDSLKAKVDILEEKLEKEADSNIELREKLKMYEKQLFNLQNKKRSRSVKTAMI